MSMLINQDNIGAFIVHLFQKRNGSVPPQDIVNSWSQVPNEEIFVHLRNMTRQWGWTEVQLFAEINTFLNTQSPVSPPYQPVNNISDTLPPEPQQTQAYTEPFHQPKRKRSYAWLVFILLVIVATGSYIFYKYNQFNNLQRLYSVTDNVAIRNAQGKTIGRMDIFGSKDAITSLRAADSEIYNIIVDRQGNISESRKLLKEDATFKDFLLDNEEKMVYVNKNYLTNSEDYGAIQKTVFAEISRYSKEMTQLQSNSRKVIIGSLALDNNLQNLYIKNPCRNNTNEYTSIIKHTLKDKKTISIICKMSDNKFYKFKGNPDENIYYPPQLIQVKSPTEGNLIEIEATDLLFKYTDGSYFIYTCNQEDTSFHARFDEDGDIEYFIWMYDSNE